MRVLARRRVYEGKVLSVDVDEVEEPGGVRATREVVRHRGSVAALPVHADGRLVLVRQYRYAVDAPVWERRRPPLSGESVETRPAGRWRGGGRPLPRVAEPLAVFTPRPSVMRPCTCSAPLTCGVPARPEADERIECAFRGRSGR